MAKLLLYYDTHKLSSLFVLEFFNISIVLMSVLVIFDENS